MRISVARIVARRREAGRGLATVVKDGVLCSAMDKVGSGFVKVDVGPPPGASAKPAVFLPHGFGEVPPEALRVRNGLPARANLEELIIALHFKKWKQKFNKNGIHPSIHG